MERCWGLPFLHALTKTALWWLNYWKSVFSGSLDLDRQNKNSDFPGQVDGAMKTTLHLTEFDDIIDPVEVYSLLGFKISKDLTKISRIWSLFLALTACASRQFTVGSRAFIKLESLESINKEEREIFENLALSIFTKHNPKDSRAQKAECTNCETLIPDYCQVKI